MFLTYRYRLYPTRMQVIALEGMLGAFCDLYNAALQQRIEAYRRRGRLLNYFDQRSELKAVRAVDDRLAGFSFTAEQEVLRRLDKAFKGFFRRLKSPKGKAGFPRFQPKSRWDSAEMRVGDGLALRKSKRIGVTGIPGDIKVKWHRPLPAGANLGAAVISRSLGRWFVCFQVELPDPGPRGDFTPVGIDLGLTSLVALSTGETVAAPQWTKAAAKGLRRRARALARCQRNSRRRRKARGRLARLHAKVAARRCDFLHKLSQDIATRFSHIAVEGLDVSRLGRMTSAKSMKNAAWGKLLAFIRYKAACAGGMVCEVDPRRTSQECPACGAVAAKTLKVREHHCECGCILDRDVAAARVILQRATWKQPGTGCGAPSRPIAA